MHRRLGREMDRRRGADARLSRGCITCVALLAPAAGEADRADETLALVLVH